MSFHSDAACGFPLATFGTPFVTTPGWSQVAALVAYPNPAAKFAVVRLRAQRAPDVASGDFVAYFDNVFARTGACAPGATRLCLANGRFQVTATWKTSDGAGNGQAVPFSSESGSFWFFSPTNLELDVKVLDACGFNSRFWVFAAGLTDVEVMLTVTDTKTLTTKTYLNSQGHTFAAVTDTNAFATCP